VKRKKKEKIRTSLVDPEEWKLGGGWWLVWREGCLYARNLKNAKSTEGGRNPGRKKEEKNFFKGQIVGGKAKRKRWVNKGRYTYWLKRNSWGSHMDKVKGKLYSRKEKGVGESAFERN